MDKNNQLETAPIGKLVFKLAIPTVMAQLVNLLYNIVDRIYVGRIPEIGSLSLAGLGVTFPIILLVSAFAMLAGMGGASRAAVSMGEKDNDKAEKILGNCTMLLIIFSVVLAVVFMLTKNQILMKFGASEATLPYKHISCRYDICTDCVGTEFVYNKSRLCKNKYDDRLHRRGAEYCA